MVRWDKLFCERDDLLAFFGKSSDYWEAVFEVSNSIQDSDAAATALIAVAAEPAAVAIVGETGKATSPIA